MRLKRFYIIYLILGIGSLAGCQSPQPKQLEGPQPTSVDAQEVVEDAGAPSARPDEPTSPPTCVPQCEERICGDDQCGSTCGVCEGETECVDGACAPTQEEPQGECSETCESQGMACGQVCGVSCGECAPQERCEAGQCVCIPDCSGHACGDSDGCGGTCAPCPRSENCEGCLLKLEVVEQTSTSPLSASVQLKLSVSMLLDASLPEMADIRLSFTGPVVIGRVGLGPALMSAQKDLIPDPATGLPYRKISENVYSFTILSTQNTDPIPSGDWLVIDLLVGDTTSEPVQVSIIKREQIFAPPSADLPLWGDTFEESVVIWPALRVEE